MFVFFLNIYYILGGIDYIQYNTVYKCYTNEYYKWSFMFVVPIIIIIAIILPGIIMYKIYRDNNSLLKRKKYTFLIGEYV